MPTIISYNKKKKKKITIKRVAKAVGIKLFEEFLVKQVEDYDKKMNCSKTIPGKVFIQLVIGTIHNIGASQTLKMLGLSKRKIKLINNIITGMEMTKTTSEQLFNFKSEFYFALHSLYTNIKKNNNNQHQ